MSVEPAQANLGLAWSGSSPSLLLRFFAARPHGLRILRLRALPVAHLLALPLARELVRLALDLRGPLDHPEEHERGGNIALADRDAVVAQHQHVAVAEARQHARTLVGVQGDALEIVIADAAREHRPIEVVVV